MLELVKRIKSVAQWEDCRDHCDEEEDCEFFKWKVGVELICFIYNFLDFSIQKTQGTDCVI